jgi:peptidoglycan hydrolase CwlO-like protein
MTDELNEFLKELVAKINRKFQEQKTRLAQIEAKLITMQREIDELKNELRQNKTKINKDILKELE